MLVERVRERRRKRHEKTQQPVTTVSPYTSPARTISRTAGVVYVLSLCNGICSPTSVHKTVKSSLVTYTARPDDDDRPDDNDVVKRTLDPFISLDQRLLARVLQGEVMYKITDGTARQYVFKCNRDFSRLSWHKSADGATISSSMQSLIDRNSY